MLAYDVLVNEQLGVNILLRDIGNQVDLLVLSNHDCLDFLWLELLLPHLALEPGPPDPLPHHTGNRLQSIHLP